jgi:hypothetical protein
MYGGSARLRFVELHPRLLRAATESASPALMRPSRKCRGWTTGTASRAVSARDIARFSEPWGTPVRMSQMSPSRYRG